MNKTKIIATIGPASSSKGMLKELIKAGMDVARINLKHATREFCIDVKSKIDELNYELNKNVALMFDTRGPILRTGKFTNGSAIIQEKTKIRIYNRELIGDSTKIFVDYPNLINEIKYDAIIKINDGKIKLQVIDKKEDCLICEVLNGGEISDNKAVNVVNHKLKTAFLSAHDIEDIKLANQLNIDFLSLSNISSYEDVEEVNDILINLGNDHLSLIAKIENARAFEDIDNIIDNCDGIMIARGDLGVEVELERVPGIQKQIIAKCLIDGKVSIVATEMMSSMQSSATPSRAEVSDVANAVLDGTDAVMLSGETTVGKYPVEVIMMVEKILKQSEQDMDYYEFNDKARRTEEKSITGNLANNVCISAHDLKCKAIFAPTISGHTPRKISRYRPFCPIIAGTSNEKVAKSLQLHFGVFPVLINELKTFDRIIDASKKISKDFIKMEKNDKIIVTGGYPFKDIKYTNFMKIEEY